MPARELFSGTDGQNLFTCGVNGDDSEKYDTTLDKRIDPIGPLKEEVKFCGTGSGASPWHRRPAPM